MTAPNARSARAFERLAQSLIDGEPNIEPDRQGIRELFYNFLTNQFQWTKEEYGFKCDTARQ